MRSPKDDPAFGEFLLGLAVFTIFFAALGSLLTVAGAWIIDLLFRTEPTWSMTILAFYGALIGAGTSLFGGMLAFIAKNMDDE